MVDLKKFIPKKEDQAFDYYWSLSIEPGWVQSSIWRINKEVVEILATGPETRWESDEDLVSATDATLSATIQTISEENIEPTKTVFGVSSSWVDGGEIKSEYLAKIKVLCKELSLTPIGFAVLPESIAHFLKSEEGAALTGVIIGLYEDSVEISVFVTGKLVGSTQVARSVSVVDDLAEGLTRFADTDPLPSRFILYDGKEVELEEAKQEIIKVNWADFGNLKILHTPKVEIYPVSRKIHAVSFAGSSELTKVQSLVVLEKSVIARSVKDMPKQIPQEKPEEIPQEVANVTKVDPKDLGFVVDEGDEDESVHPPSFAEAPRPLIVQQPDDVAKKPGLPPINKTFLENKTSVLKKFKFPKPGQFVFGNKTLAWGLLFIALFLIGGFLFWWFRPTAKVTIYVSPKTLKESVTLTVDTKKDSVNFSEKSLPGQVISKTVHGDRTRQSTGVKVVGDRAHGQVTLYRVGSKVTLSKGTSITGTGGLKFTLDDDTEVASGSASTPGTTDTKVSASDIGAIYNLASNSNFSIANFSTSDIEGKNSTSFSGGSSQEVSAVSAEDQKRLLKDLEDELSAKVKSESAVGLAADLYLIDQSLATNDTTKVFNHKVGDEADTLELSLELKGDMVAVKKSQLLDVVKEVLKDKVPSGFVLKGEQVSYDFALLKSESGVYSLDTKISANLLPTINTNLIQNKIRGRNKDMAQSYLTKEVPGFVRAEIKLEPKIFARLLILPHVADHIFVTISAEK